MLFGFFLFYGGPDQVMTVTSGLASALGLLLIFWHRVVGLFFKMVRKIKGEPEPISVEAAKAPPVKTS